MSESRLLIVDDEPQLVRVLLPSFVAAGYEVSSATNAGEALQAVAARSFDAIILDLGLPDLDGKEVIARVRARSDAPIIVLSARDGEQEKIDALDLGANDFVNKPFNIGELMARVRAALRHRRPSAAAGEALRIGHLDVDFATRRVRVKGKEVRLSPREFKLLRVFTERLDEVLTHRQIVAAVWETDENIEAQFVRVLVANLRQKIELDPKRPQLVVTEAGIGYRLRAPEPRT
jgi:two-component system KDP operon response regulator KdpE